MKSKPQKSKLLKSKPPKSKLSKSLKVKILVIVFVVGLVWLGRDEISCWMYEAASCDTVYMLNGGPPVERGVKLWRRKNQVVEGKYLEPKPESEASKRRRERVELGLQSSSAWPPEKVLRRNCQADKDCALQFGYCGISRPVRADSVDKVLLTYIPTRGPRDDCMMGKEKLKKPAGKAACRKNLCVVLGVKD